MTDAIFGLILVSWGLSLAAAAGILLRKLPVRYSGGPMGAFLVGALSLGFHVAGLLNRLGPADAAAATFGALFAAGGFAVAIDRARGGSPPMPPMRSIYPSGPIGYAGTLLVGAGFGLVFGAPLQSLLSFTLFATSAAALIVVGFTLRAFAVQNSGPEASG